MKPREIYSEDLNKPILITDEALNSFYRLYRKAIRDEDFKIFLINLRRVWETN